MRWTAIPLLSVALASLVACSESSLPMEPTPVTPSILTFAGVMSESGTNTPLAGATICFTLQHCTSSGADGSYRLTIDPAVLSVRIGPYTTLCGFAFLDEYELRSACPPPINYQVSWSTTLQRKITVDAGRSVRSTIFKGEGNGLVDDGLCEPCKSVNVLVPGSGTLFLSAAGDSPESKVRVSVFYEGFENGALQITNQHTVQVIVHAAVAPTAFELVTSFTPAS